MYAESLKRWIGVALIIAAVLATAFSWQGQSLRDLLASLLR